MPNIYIKLIGDIVILVAFNLKTLLEQKNKYNNMAI